MSSTTFFIVELLTFNGIILAWAFWELWKLKRDRAEDPPSETPSPDDARHPEG